MRAKLHGTVAAICIRAGCTPAASLAPHVRVFGSASSSTQDEFVYMFSPTTDVFWTALSKDGVPEPRKRRKRNTSVHVPAQHALSRHNSVLREQWGLYQKGASDAHGHSLRQLQV